MFATGETKIDQIGRKRAAKRAKKVAILAGQCVWSTTGRTQMLAWMLADGEDSVRWQTSERDFDDTLTFFASLEQANR